MTKVIAALETNHQGEAALAKRLVEIAIAAGCWGVKLPIWSVHDSFTADYLNQPYHDYPEFGDTIGAVLERLQLGSPALADVRQATRDRVQFIAAPYDLASLDLADTLDPDAYQVDAPVLTHLQLVHEVAARGKPVLVAAGLCGEPELDRCLKALAGLEVTLLHCVFDVADLAGTALRYLERYRDRYGTAVGYLSLEPRGCAALVACALGATVIERPLTLDRALRGPTHLASADRDELAGLIRAIRALQQALAPVGPRTLMPCELERFTAGRVSLVAARDLRAGAVLAPDMIATKAPLRGISPLLLDHIVGKRLLYDLPADTPITFGMIEP